jgi:catechol O-methyltransferase
MNVGEDKGRIVTDLIKENKPTTMIELGGYIGYSTILFASALKEAGGKKYLSFERNPEFAAVISSLVDLAGLRDMVQVVVGSSDTGIKRMHKEGVLKKIDFMFLDHYKPAYTTDLKLCEELGLVGPGSVYAADNCIVPGNPPYVEYVSASCEEKTKMANDERANSGWDERMAASAVGQYNRREGEGKADEKVKGVPELVYESKMVESFEPTGEKDGVMVTKCVGDGRQK